MATAPDTENQNEAAEPMEALSHEELAALLAEDERLAISFRDTTLAEEQAVAIDYYEARPFGDEEDGLSQVVTPEVAEVVDYMTISVSRTMVSGDRVVEFESAEQDDEGAAEEATAAVEYCFLKQQDGYRVIHDSIQSGLIEKIGVIKTCVEHSQRVKKTRGMVDEDQLTMLHQQGANIAAATPGENGAWQVEIHETVTDTKFLDYSVPSEEFLFASRTRHEDDSDYLCHRSLKTESDLIEMGFDRELIEDLPDSGSVVSMTDSRSVARWSDETTYDTPGVKKYWLREEYKRVDMDGDGIAELVQVFRVDTTILGVEEVDEAPFVVWCPFPRAHRLVGSSLADKVMDLQRVKSVVLRQQLNGLYLTNNPRMYVPESCITEDTIDDLLTVRPGGIVRGKGPDGPKSLYEAFDMSKGMTMLTYITAERESRTGITRLNQGLDADALNKTATGTALLQAQGQQMEEYVARNFAEGLARLFAKKLRLMVAVGKPFPIKVDGQAKTVDPTKWPEGLSANVRVGLGSGRKDQRLQYRDMVLDVQKDALPMGLTTKKHIYNNISDGARDMGFNPSDLFVDPDSPEGQQIAQGLAQAAQQQPNPEMQKVQAQIEAQKQQLALKAQGQQADTALKVQAAQAKLDAETGKTAAQMQTAGEKADAEAQLELRRQDMEASLSERELAINAMLEHHKATLAHEASMTKARNGGALDK
jgi:hypothetical protein